MTTPLLGLQEIAEGTASQAALHNTALRQFEARFVRVLSKSTTAPPGSPVESDSYIIPSGATGVWSGLTNQIAAWIGGAWVYYTPVHGVSIWVNDLDLLYAFNGTTWGTAAGSGSVTSVSVVTANGVSGSVANPSTTPAITLTLGAITPTSVAASGALSGSNLSGTNTGDNPVLTDGTMAANSSTQPPSQSAVVSYVATQLDGRSWKQDVKAATTTNGTLATAFVAAAVIDGVVLVVGDRLLIKNQSTASENGIYIVTVGTPTRATDADTGAELVEATVGVAQGTANANTQWTQTTPATITIGSSSIVWVEISAGTVYTADETTIHLSGSQFSLKAGAVGIDTHAATGKTTPVDADEIPIADSAASYGLKKLTWANLKTTLKTYFDTLYATVSQPFDLGAFYPGAPTASAKITRIPVARAVSFSANFAGSYAKAGTAATASTAIDVQKNGSSIGTITFAASGTSATFVTSGGSAQSLVAGDVLSIIAPASPDSTLADIGFVLTGTR